MTHAASPRRGWLRVATSVAAGLIVAVAVFSLQRTHSPAALSVATPTAKTDRIFAAIDDRASARANGGDRIFKGEFKSDQIFKASGG